MSSYGLTTQGFVIKELSVIQSELVDDFQYYFGADIDVSADSVAGQYIGNLSNKFATLWELMAAIYASFNPDSNNGISLDGSLALVGTRRLQATQSSVVEACYGSEGSVIPEGHLIGMDNGTTWKVSQGGIITDDRLIDCQIQLINDPSAGDVHTVTINSITYSYTAVGGDSKLAVVTALKALIDAGSVSAYVTTSITDDVLRIYSSDGKTAFICTISASTVQYATLGSPFTYLCETYGAIAAPSGTINVITQPVSGLTSVNNLADATQGRNIETDSAARIRRRSALTANSCGSDLAIASHLLEDVANVTYAKVYSNRTDSVDGEGRPAHSFEAIVLGGSDTEIAELIWNIKSAGIQTYGNTYADITDLNGDIQRIYFSRPTSIYIWINITVTRTSEEEFPSNGVALIKQGIIDWTDDNIVIGGDIFWQRFFSPTYGSCQGISDASIEIGYSTDPLVPPVSYASANIPIATREIGVFADSRITVGVS